MPNRILKESICTSENVDRLTAFEETVFYRLMVNCDDYGRFDARPKILQARLFPLKEIDLHEIVTALNTLSTADLVILYEVDAKPYLQMKTWDRHQQVRNRKSKYPSPDEGERKQLISIDSNCNQLQSIDSNCQQLTAIDSNCSRNPIQSESNPNPNPNTRGSAKRFTPPTVDEVKAYCQERNNNVDAERFIDYYSSKGWIVGKSPMKDWKATVRNWERDSFSSTGKTKHKPFDERTITDDDFGDGYYADIMNRPRAGGAV